MIRVIQSIVAAAMLLAAGFGQQFPVVRTLQGTRPAVIPPTVASIEDVDGDGIRDVLIGYARRTSNLGIGEVEIVSGGTGAPIRTIARPVGATTLFGALMKNVGDWDGDSIADVLVGDSGFGGGGAVFVFSSATGAEITRFVGASSGGLFGIDADAVPDIDGDGLPEILVGAPGHAVGGTVGVGLAEVLSSMTGLPLSTFVGLSFAENLGTSVAVVEDIDFDGRRDYLVGAPGRLGTPGALGTDRGAGLVFSAVSGALLRVLLNPSSQGSAGGSRVAAVDDMDGDGNPEMLVSWPATIGGGGAIGIFNRFGAPVRTIEGGIGFGTEVDLVSDVNGDGVRDIGIAELAFGPAFETLTVTRIVSGVDGCSLFAITDTASTSGPATRSFAGTDDVNGDGFADLVVGRRDPLGSAIVTGAGHGTYSGAGGPLQTLSLGWSPGMSEPLDGVLALTGGSAMGAVALLLSIAPAAIPVGGFDVLVDPTPGAFLALLATLDGSGAFTMPLSIDVPAFSGLPVFLQGFEASAASPIGFFASNGLELMLSRTDPVPSVNSITPGWLAGGFTPFMIEIRGNCFEPGLSVHLNGAVSPLFIVQIVESERIVLAGLAPTGFPLDSTLEIINPNGASTTIPFNSSPAVDSHEVFPEAQSGNQLAAGEISTVGGELVTLRGGGFYDGCAVSVAGATVPLVSRTDGAVSFHSPAVPAGPALVQMFSPNGGQTSYVIQAVQVSPLISIVTPITANAGEVVTVRGSYFAAGAAFMLGGQPLVPQSFTRGPGPAPDEVVYLQPAGLGCDDVLVVTNPDMASDTFVVNPTPVITSSTPNGPAVGGAFVTLSGPIETLLGTSVTIDGIPVQIFNLGGPNQGVAFITPAHAPGVVTITVTNAVGCSVSVPYTYI